MGGYLLKRIVTFIPVLLMVGILSGLLIDFIPGDPVILLLGHEAPGEAIEAKRVEMGLDRPVHVRLGEWLWNAAHGDLGDSYFLSKPVTRTILERAEVTLWLALLGISVAAIVGIILGVISSVYQGRFLDWIIQVTSMIGLSIPGFWLAILFIYMFAVNLRILPIGGFVPPLKDLSRFGIHMVLPVFTLSISFMGIIARFTRTSMLEVLREEYITTARGKGVKERVVLFKHALRNALIPIITVIGIGFGDMLGNAVVVETVYNLPGVGRLILDGVNRRDYPIIQGGIVVLTAAYLTVNLIVDILYTWLEKRISFE